MQELNDCQLPTKIVRRDKDLKGRSSPNSNSVIYFHSLTYDCYDKVTSEDKTSRVQTCPIGLGGNLTIIPWIETRTCLIDTIIDRLSL